MSRSGGRVRLVGDGAMFFFCVFLCQAEGGIRYLVRSRGLGDGYKRQGHDGVKILTKLGQRSASFLLYIEIYQIIAEVRSHCLLYTSDAADERSSVDLGGRRIIKKKT